MADDKDAVSDSSPPPESVQGVGDAGKVATDQHGNALVNFDPAAERRLRWKIDLCVVPTVSILYLFCFIDRANIGNARLAGLERDLGLQGYDYNTALSIFFISYILFEIPCNILCKWMGPGWFLPATTVGFGVMTIATAAVDDLSQICGVRFLLGLFEAGMLPGIAYYLSRWYRRSELSFRLALYTNMAPLAGAFGGLLASAILTLDNFGEFTSWRMIFAIEGIVTVILGFVSFAVLTDRPETAIWLTQDEKDLAIARLKSERIGTTAVLDNLQTKKIILGIVNPVTLVTGFIFLLDNITVQGFAFFLPTIVSVLYPSGSVVSQQLRTVPPYVVGAFFNLLFPFISWRIDRRNIFIIASAPMIMAGYLMFLASESLTVRYGGTFLIASGAFTFAAFCNGQVSANVVSDTARGSAIGAVVMLGNIGGLISTWSFLPFDRPDFHIGNGLNFAGSSTILILATGLQFWMTADNKKRDNRNVEAELAGMDAGEIEDLDWKHPGFRWRP